MRSFMLYIIDKLWPTFIAVVVTQFVTQRFIEMRKPSTTVVIQGLQFSSETSREENRTYGNL